MGNCQSTVYPGDDPTHNSGDPSSVSNDDSVHNPPYFPLLGISIDGIYSFINKYGGKEALANMSTEEIVKLFIIPKVPSNSLSYCDTLYNKRDIGDANVYVTHPWKGNFLGLVNSLENWINTQQLKQRLYPSTLPSTSSSSVDSTTPTVPGVMVASSVPPHPDALSNVTNNSSNLSDPSNPSSLTVMTTTSPPINPIIPKIIERAKLMNPKDFPSSSNSTGNSTTMTVGSGNDGIPSSSASTGLTPTSILAPIRQISSASLSLASLPTNGPAYYFWIDIFSIPQKKAIKNDYTWWINSLLPSIGHIQHTLCVVQWKSMLTFSRLWCLWEIYAAMKTSCTFEIIMNRDEESQFLPLLLHDYETINTKLCTLEIGKAFAHTEADALNIRDAFAHTHNDFDETNKALIDYIRLWFLQYTDYLLCQYQAKQQETTVIGTCIARTLHHLGYDQDAENLFTLILSTRQELYGNKHPDTVTAIFNLALYYNDIENYAKAEPLFIEALSIRREILPVNHMDTLQLLNTLGSLYHHTGKYSEAERMYREAIDGMKALTQTNENSSSSTNIALSNVSRSVSTFGSNEPLEQSNNELIKLVFMNNLASLLKLKGQINDAEFLFRTIVEARIKLLGKTHPDTIASISNLAMICKVQGKYAEAEVRYREALEARITRFGINDTDTLTLMHTLGILVKSMGRYAEAEQICHEVLNLRRKVLGPNHADTLGSLTTVAKLQQALGQFSSAESLYREAIEIRKQVSGPSHNETLILMNQLTVLLRSIGRYTEAQDLCLITVNLRKETLGADHTDTLVSMHVLASIYQVQQKYTEAENLYRDILDKRRNLLGNVHRDTLTALNDLGSLLLLHQKYAEAEPLFREALDGRRQTLGSHHSDTITSLSNLATCLENLNRFSEAEPLFHEVFEARKQSNDKAVPHIFVAKKHVAALVKNRRASASNIGPEAY